MQAERKADMAFERVPRPDSLAALAYRQLRETVLSGGIREGQVVSVVSIAADLGMSRSPVRSAIERLVSEGLMNLTPGGAIIATPDRDELINALVVRTALEGLAARLAVPALDEKGLGHLRKLHRQLVLAIQAGASQRIARADLDFHQAIQYASENSCLIETLDRLQARIILASYAIEWPDLHPVIDEHQQILAALEARDARTAERAAIQHLTKHQIRMRDAPQRSSSAEETA
jgi:DNA-binding GntR family transcriptional regulator